MKIPRKQQRNRIISDYAKSIGIDLVGFTSVGVDPLAVENYKKFVSEKRHGEMQYLEDSELRFNADKILPGAKSVIVIGLNYFREQAPLPNGHGRIARYAFGRDYHKVIRSYLKKLERFIIQNFPDTKTRICVDSAPLPEKYYAVKAGLGFIGKNTTLITKEFGSYVLLGEILTDLEFEDEKENGKTELTEQKFTCGTCARCIEACPLKALSEPYKMDAKKCISYLTIENKQEIPAELADKMGCGIFGCDICQEVCPYNKTYAKKTNQKDFNKAIAGESIPLKEIEQIKDQKQFVARFAGSPLMRAGLKGMQKNIRACKSGSKGS